MNKDSPAERRTDADLREPVGEPRGWRRRALTRSSGEPMLASIRAPSDSIIPIRSANLGNAGAA